MNRIKILLVDDEPLARTGLQHLLDRDPEIEVVAQAENGRSGLAAIDQHRPDAMFLDVQMPDMSGLQMLELLPAARRPIVVFVTAYDEFAIRAFDLHAVDYLVKPFTNARFAKALARLKSLARSRGAVALDEGLQKLLEHFQGNGAPTAASATPEVLPQRVVVKADRDLHFIEYDDIVWIEGQGDYLKFHAGKNSVLIRERMTHIEQRLDPEKFIRVHKSAIVNLEKVKKIVPIAYGDHVLQMTDGASVRIGRSFRDKLARVVR